MDKNKMMQDSISGKPLKDLNYEQALWLMESGTITVLNGALGQESATFIMLDFDIGMKSKKVCAVYGAGMTINDFQNMTGEMKFYSGTRLLEMRAYFEQDLDLNDWSMSNTRFMSNPPRGGFRIEPFKKLLNTKEAQDFLATKTIHWQR
jgi:hypothetical protein